MEAAFSMRSVPGAYKGTLGRGFRGWTPQGPTIVGTGNGTPEVPELPNAWGYGWGTLSPGVINTER
jgi:hypothetical protein